MVFEPVSTMLMKRFTPSVWMSRIMLTWGIVSMLQATTTNYSGMLACRFFLGLAESGFYPGVIYHFSFWYSPERMPMRIAFFYACGMFSGTISGLLAYAISFMNGVGGLAGWRWVFILEGIPPVLCSIYTYFMLPNYPETEKFLTEPEREVIISALPVNAPNMNAKTFDLQQVIALFKDPTFVPFSLIWALHGIGGWGISFVLPSIIYSLGFTDTARSQLMTMPPYAAVFILLNILGYLIRRGVFSVWIVGIALESVQVLMYILLLTIHNRIAKYMFVLIATACAQSICALMWPERIRATKGTSSAGMAIGMTNAFTQLMGIVGPQIYNTKFGPTYKVSYVCSVMLLSACTGIIALTWWLVWRKDKAERVAAEGGEKFVYSTKTSSENIDEKIAKVL